MKTIFTSLELKKPQDFRQLFNNNQNLILDIGAGKGEFAIRMATEFPNNNYICIEKKSPRAMLINRKCEKAQLTNLIILHARIEHLIPHCFFPQSVQQAFMNFPDPWVKNKYRNKRNLTVEFLDDLSSILKSHADFYFATDICAYAEHSYQLLDQHQNFSNALSTKWIINEASPYFQTLFYQHAVKAGSDCYFLHFKRK